MRDVRFSMRETIEKFAPNAIKGFARGHQLSLSMVNDPAKDKIDYPQKPKGKRP